MIILTKKTNIMKNKVLIIGVFLLLTASISFGQKGISTVDILTNPDCVSCKKTIETELVYTKGVKDAILNMDTKIVTVEYKSSKITEQKIIDIIIELGYEAKKVNKQ